MITSRLPVNIQDLLRGRLVEHDRLEYKAGWNPDSIMRSICAFANDFRNLGGGYVIIGVEEEDGRPLLPPIGVSEEDLDTIQKELLRYCNMIQPAYAPVLSIEEVGGKCVVVLWCHGGTNRPYKAPKAVTSKEKDYHYYIRRYSSSVVAKDGELRELMELAADVPFDDRVNHKAGLYDLKPLLIGSFLHAVKSDLASTMGSLPFIDLCRQMMIVDGSEEYLKPRNVGILFFNDRPDTFFPMTQIDVVHFIDGASGDQLDERIFTGPLDQQLRDALTYIRNMLIRERVVKHPDRAEADRFFNYPYAALEEALVNAVYHRSYELREPIEVRINPDSIEILSFPGPDRSISLDALNRGRVVARRYRNRRIGDFLKELDLTEGRGTGLPKIHRALEANGSPAPVIETDEERTSFLIRIPVHPGFEAHDEAHDGAHDKVSTYAALNDTAWRLLELAAVGPIGNEQIRNALAHAGSRSGNVKNALYHLMKLGLIEYTIPDKPRSKLQRRRITSRGLAYLNTRH